MDSNRNWKIGLTCVGLIVVPPFVWALWQHLAEYFYAHTRGMLLLIAAFLFMAWLEETRPSKWVRDQLWNLEDATRAGLRRLFRRSANSA